MDDWFGIISSGSELSERAAKALRDVGFAVIPGPVGAAGMTVNTESGAGTTACRGRARRWSWDTSRLLSLVAP
jgi:hypothetical protein